MRNVMALMIVALSMAIFAGQASADGTVSAVKGSGEVIIQPDGTITITVTRPVTSGSCIPVARLKVRLHPNGRWINQGRGHRTEKDNSYVWTWDWITFPYYRDGIYDWHVDITCGLGIEEGIVIVDNSDIDYPGYDDPFPRSPEPPKKDDDPGDDGAGSGSTGGGWSDSGGGYVWNPGGTVEVTATPSDDRPAPKEQSNPAVRAKAKPDKRGNKISPSARPGSGIAVGVDVAASEASEPHPYTVEYPNGGGASILSVQAQDLGDGTTRLTVTRPIPPSGSGSCDLKGYMKVRLRPDGTWKDLGEKYPTVESGNYVWTWNWHTCGDKDGEYDTHADLPCGFGTDDGTANVHNVDIDTDSDNDDSIEAEDDPIEENYPGKVVAVSDFAAATLYWPTSNGCKVTLDVSNESVIKLWKNTAKNPSDAIPTGTTYVIGTDSIPSTIYVEGCSLGPGTVTFVHKKADNTAICSDVVKIMVWDVAMISPVEATKVLISKRSDTGDTWPSPCQTENRKILITAKAVPPVSGVDIYFRSFDVDDASSYETNTTDGDNNGGIGTLSLAPGYSGGSDYCTTDANGRAKMLLEITDRYSGDNYVVAVRSGSLPTSPVDDMHTGMLVAWKRLYIEQDRMYRVGSDLSADFTPDGDSNPDTVSVTNTSWCSVGDSIVIFDADHPDGETASVTAKTASSVTLSIDLSNSYDAGYPGKGAAVAKPSQGYYESNLGRITNAFGSDTTGTDGGSFVEFLSISDGAKPAPHMTPLGDTSTPTLVDFGSVWFKNSGKTNYIQVVGAENCRSSSDSIYGMCAPSTNNQYTYVGTIERLHPTEVAVRVQDTTAHESGHEFNLANTDSGDNALCHLGTDYCVMSYLRDRADTITEFCYNNPITNPNHLGEVRTATDGR